MKEVLFILSGIIGCGLFMFIKNKLFNKSKEVIEKTINPEAWDTKKFIAGIANITSPKKWGETLHAWFNIRNIIIVTLFLGIYGGYMYWKGMGHARFLPFTEEWIMKIDDHYLHWDVKLQEMHIQNSSDIKSLDKIKVISVKDIPNLYAKLKPYGFQLKPIVVLAVGRGSNKIKGEIGAGLSWFKWFNWRTDSSITNRGLYPLGIHYKITQNSGIGLSGGIGFEKGDLQRINIKYICEY